MSADDDWSLISLLALCVKQCSSVEFMPLTDENVAYHVYCHCEEQIYLCFNILEIKSIVNTCYSLLFSKNQYQDNEALNRITRVLLCCVSECLTSWNIRRRLLLAGVVTTDEELRFSAMILRLKPKSEQIFRYRRFILRQQQPNEISPQNELRICDQTAEAHHVNYGSWQHRRWIVEHLNIDQDDEFDRNRAWLERHISDYSGHSFRTYLLARKIHPNKTHLIEEEFQINANLLKFYYDRESLWIYRQTLVLLLTNLHDGLSSAISKELLRKEIDFVKTFDKNMFAEKYNRLLNALLSSDGQEFF